MAQQALLALSKLTATGRQSEKLSDQELAAIRILKERVIMAPPTKIRTTSLDTWYVFSDGACEGETSKEGSIGAVLISPCGIACEFFAEIVPKEWMEAFLSLSQHPIFELELLPIAARATLISGSTQSVSGSWIARTFTVNEINGQLKVWFASVPTRSNIADKPSRLDVTELNAEGINRVDIKWTYLLEQCQKYKSEKWGDG